LIDLSKQIKSFQKTYIT